MSFVKTKIRLWLRMPNNQAMLLIVALAFMLIGETKWIADRRSAMSHTGRMTEFYDAQRHGGRGEEFLWTVTGRLCAC